MASHAKTCDDGPAAKKRRIEMAPRSLGLDQLFPDMLSRMKEKGLGFADFVTDVITKKEDHVAAM